MKLIASWKINLEIWEICWQFIYAWLKYNKHNRGSSMRPWPSPFGRAWHAHSYHRWKRKCCSSNQRFYTWAPQRVVPRRWKFALFLSHIPLRLQCTLSKRYLSLNTHSSSQPLPIFPAIIYVQLPPLCTVLSFRSLRKKSKNSSKELKRVLKKEIFFSSFPL